MHRTMIFVVGLSLAACSSDDSDGSSAGSGGTGGNAGAGAAGAAGIGGTAGVAGSGSGGFGQTSELSYDDDAMDEANSPWSTDAGGRIAQCFTPPTHPMRLDTLRFFVANAGQPTTQFRARVYDAAGSEPGNDLVTATLTGAATGSNQWVEIALGSDAPVIASGDFCVAMEWTTAPGMQGADAQFLGTDSTSPDARTWWSNPGATTWVPIAKVGGSGDRDAMIRAVIAF